MCGDCVIGPDLELGVADSIDAVEHLDEHDAMSRGEEVADLAEEGVGIAGKAGNVECFGETVEFDDEGDADGDLELHELSAVKDDGRVSVAEVAQRGFEAKGGIFGEDQGRLRVRLKVDRVEEVLKGRGYGEDGALLGVSMVVVGLRVDDLNGDQFVTAIFISGDELC